MQLPTLKYLHSADYIRIQRTVKNPEDCNMLQFYTYSTQYWHTANYMKLSISKFVIFFSRKTNVLTYDYKLC
jgi:hypothetical protein